MLPSNYFLHGRYRIIRPLGHGGFGRVYEALDDNLDCIVAIKERRAEHDTPKMRRAFEREAKLLANLRHYALPKVIHHFFEGDGQYLVMEFIEGDDFSKLLSKRRTPFSAEEILPWADDILKALEYLHARPEPIIHRDIKPANLKLTDRGEIFLLDFGLAKGSAGSMYTPGEGQRSSSVHGYTEAYAPLEQLNNSGTDERSDIYSFGATLYQLLTGRVPVSAAQRYRSLDLQGKDILPLAYEANPAVPFQMSLLLSQAMALHRRDRLASATEMRAALARVRVELEEVARRATEVTESHGSESPERELRQERSSSSAGPAPPAQPQAPPPFRREDPPFVGTSVGSIRQPENRPAEDARQEPQSAQDSWPSQVNSEAHNSQWPSSVHDEEEAALQRAAEEARRTAEAARQAEEEAQRKAEEERQLAEEARLRAEQEAETRRREAEARKVAEEESRQRRLAEEQARIETDGQKARLTNEKTAAAATALAEMPEAHQQSTLQAHPARMKSPAPHAEGRPLQSRRRVFVLTSIVALLVLTVVSAVVVSLNQSQVADDNDAPGNLNAEPSRSAQPPPPQAPSSLSLRSTMADFGGKVWAVACAPDGTMIAAANEGGRIRVWDAKTLSEKFTIEGSAAHTKDINSIAFSHDSRMIASGSSDQTIRLWNSSDGTPVRIMGRGRGEVLTLTFSPDDKVLASAGTDGNVYLWDVGSGSLSGELKGHQGEVWSVAISPDGTTLASGSSDNTLRLWDISRNSKQHELRVRETISLSFSPDGQILATGHRDNLIRLWKWKTDSPPVELKGHRGYIASLAFMPSGTILASASADKTIKLWDIQTRSVRQTLTEKDKGHTDKAYSVSFSPDGKTLISGSRDETVKVWQ